MSQTTLATALVTLIALLVMALNIGCANTGRPGQVYVVVIRVERDAEGLVDRVTVWRIEEAPQRRRVRITIPNEVLERKRAELRDTWPADPGGEPRYAYFFYDPAHPERDAEL